MGKPEASITSTISFRLCGQFLAGPKTVFDQSLDRTNAAISGGSGISETECRDPIVAFKKSAFWRRLNRVMPYSARSIQTVADF